MELVYLWVEEYKNIKQQGFNFSPRFTCSFKAEYEKYTDENGEEKEKLKDNCELVINPKEHIENFFGKNINVTAIVGENGGGKTSLLEFIKLLSSNSEHNLEKFFIVYRSSGDYKLMQHDMKVAVNTLRCLDTKFTLEDNDEVFWINYKGKIKTDRLANVINKQSFYNTSDNEYFISKHIHAYNKYHKILMLLKSKYKFTKFQVILKYKQRKIFDEKNIALNTKYETIFKNLQSQQDTKFEIFANNANKKAYSSFEKQLEYNVFISYIENLSEFIDTIDIGNQNIKESFENFMNESLTRIIEHSKQQHDCSIIYKELELYGEFLKKDKSFISFHERIDDFNKSIIYIKELGKGFMLNDNMYIYTIELSNQRLIDEIISNTQAISALTNTSEYIFNFIDYDFINTDSNIKFSSLSSGEQSILEIIVDLIHHLDLYKNKNSIIIADEIDNSLHPQWNKTLVLELVDIFKNIIGMYPDTYIHFLIASHSPFILSDLPKENVIFLEKDKNGNCKNVTRETNIQTFGANIHTLLSHGFFMKDGLMGVFAKGKIDEVIKFLNGDTQSKIKDNDEAQKLLNIIGEPIIKNQLQRMLDSKRLSKVDEIDELKKRIAILESQQ